MQQMLQLQLFLQFYNKLSDKNEIVTVIKYYMHAISTFQGANMQTSPV